jgi:hypothetical protein
MRELILPDGRRCTMLRIVIQRKQLNYCLMRVPTWMLEPIVALHPSALHRKKMHPMLPLYYLAGEQILALAALQDLEVMMLS